MVRNILPHASARDPNQNLRAHIVKMSSSETRTEEIKRKEIAMLSENMRLRIFLRVCISFIYFFVMDVIDYYRKYYKFFYLISILINFKRHIFCNVSLSKIEK